VPRSLLFPAAITAPTIATIVESSAPPCTLTRSCLKWSAAATSIAVVAEELSALQQAQGGPFSVVLHGGEPLLLGASRLEGMLKRLRQALGPICGISIQTNGVLISNAILDICADQNVTLSVSLDGPPEVHDRFRLDFRDRVTHTRVIKGIETLRLHPAGAYLFSGILAVVDPQSSADSVYSYFKELGVPSVDFLYRDGNHTVLPYGKASTSSHEYGRWITRILDLYLADREPFRIRMLDDMIKLLLGGSGVKEGVGLTDYGILVVDTDGSAKKNDTLKSSPPGDSFDFDWKIGTHSLVDIATSPAFASYHLAQRPTSTICLECPNLKVCGGGMLTHRFKDGFGYDNPTVFCADQQMLIARMRVHINAFLHPALVD
jgi:uncharacterized protein